jgi:hypothetical protein
MFLGARWLPAALTIPTVAWARWDAGNHTVKELFWGVLIGGLMTPAQIFILRGTFGGS